MLPPSSSNVTIHHRSCDYSNPYYRTIPSNAQATIRRIESALGGVANLRLVKGNKEPIVLTQ